ncbi:hypothetical protein SAMN04487993_102557 [Salipiger marinus]|uniref:Uncharacterized protein n=1 Tax=Salipiger marinus TaxID=555512 RepID=A0A1G8SQ79_9RHOB|nr:hypothetical protein SAMN04487993_102557 [Salipiger marinus]
MSHHMHQSLPSWPRPIRRMALAKAFGEPCPDPAAVPMGPCAGHGHGAAPDHETGLTCGEGAASASTDHPVCARPGEGAGIFLSPEGIRQHVGSLFTPAPRLRPRAPASQKADLSQERAQDVVALPEQYGGTGRPKWRVSGAAGGPPNPAEGRQSRRAPCPDFTRPRASDPSMILGHPQEPGSRPPPARPVRGGLTQGSDRASPPCDR